MINTSKAKWELSENEIDAIEWFNNNGFEGTLDKQFQSKTKFTVTKNGVTDSFELYRYETDIDRYMKQYERSFEMLCELKRLKAELNSR